VTYLTYFTTYFITVYVVMWLSADSADERVTSVDDRVVLIQDDELDVSDSCDTEDLDDGADNEDFNEISVPLTVVLSVIGGYIIIGTVLFGLWEGWNTMKISCSLGILSERTLITLGGLGHFLI